jgi:DNA polymerase
MRCHIDFETRSLCDLKKAGAWAYAEHPTTEIMCLCYHFAYKPSVGGDGQWAPGCHDQTLYNLASDPSVIFVAHNAMFEQAIWANIMVPLYGFPPIPIERWECTLAVCAHKALPLALDKAASALGLTVEKDKEGNRLTLSMSRFDKKGYLPELTPEKRDRIAQYCDQDVRVERQIEQRVGRLGAHERKIWMYDQIINQRGVRLDMAFVRAALRVVERATGPLQREFADLTGGIGSGQVAKVLEWCRGQGVEVDNLQKGTITALLGTEEDDSDATAGLISNLDDEVGVSRTGPLPAGVHRVLTIRQMLGSASVKKLQRMLACVGDDGRARGLLQYHAASTGRWGGRLLQPQNFPRGDDGLRKRATPEQVVDAIMSEDPEYVEAVLGLPAIEAVASALRFALIPDPGKVFLVGDYAGIEMRIVLALAGEYDKCEMLAAGHDVYLDMACDIYNRPRGSLTKDHVAERTIGKNTVLGCGFGMGATKFHARYCPDQSEDFAYNVVQAYRQQWAPKVPKLWYALDAAALAAVRGQPTTEYGVLYRQEGDWLTARLPSGWQKLWYFAPQLGRDEMFNRNCWTYRAMKMGKMVNAKAYGGLLTENAVQALARGLLCGGVQRLEQAGFPVVLTVHDEIVCEVDEGSADLAGFKQLMEQRSPWAETMQIPVQVEEWQGDRYRK